MEKDDSFRSNCLVENGELPSASKFKPQPSTDLDPLRLRLPAKPLGGLRTWRAIFFPKVIMTSTLTMGRFCGLATSA